MLACSYPQNIWLFILRLDHLDSVGDTEWQDPGQYDCIGSSSTGNMLFLWHFPWGNWSMIESSKSNESHPTRGHVRRVSPFPHPFGSMPCAKICDACTMYPSRGHAVGR